MAAEDEGVKMAVNGQVFFLVQEQAKSIVAIQALQTRMAVLESLQERLMRAIDDVHQHLAKNPTTKTHHSERVLGTDKKLRFEKQDLSKSDSLNKDSGISESSLSPNDGTHLPESEDELLQLLELIDQKSLMLLKQVEGTSMLQQMDSSSSSNTDGQSGALLDTLLYEKVNTQRQLSEVKAERDDLRQRLAKLELATEAVTKQKMKVQQELDATLIENQTLQERIQKNGDGGRKTESLGYLLDIERANIKKKYLQNSEKSRAKVSLILKEGNVLELQKQLLAYVMENDVLRAKLQQDEPARMATWLRIESQLRKKLKESYEDNQRLKELLMTREIEIASLKDKIRGMQEDTEGEDDSSCVKNFGMGSTEDWREPGVQNMYNKRSNLANASPFSPLGYGDFSKTQSLPAMLMLDAKLKEQREESMQAHYNHVYDTGSFTDVPLTSSYQPQSKDLVDLYSPVEPNFSSTSTLVQSNLAYHQPTLLSGISAPNLSGRQQDVLQQNWALKNNNLSSSQIANNDANVGAKLVNGHLCWKGADRPPVRHHSEDISSICTEFDPLSDDTTPSGENFVDSLNLSIPLKPTQVAMSQLSSIGDSLHSNSLDLGCASSPILFQDSCKVHNARSVDGMRELFIGNGYCKRPVSSQYGHSRVTPPLEKSGRRMPVNIMNYMHESSDYSLL